MSIDAKVTFVEINENGGGILHLEDRKDSRGRKVGCAGQKTLRYDKGPYEDTALNGLEIWGGSDSIMLGDIEIARRVGYNRIEFHDRETFKRAVNEYNKSKR